jgi:hypothetical protein
MNILCTILPGNEHLVNPVQDHLALHKLMLSYLKDVWDVVIVDTLTALDVEIVVVIDLTC